MLKSALCMELVVGDMVDINHGQVLVEVRKAVSGRVRIVFLAPKEIPISRAERKPKASVP